MSENLEWYRSHVCTKRRHDHTTDLAAVLQCAIDYIAEIQHAKSNAFASREGSL